MKIQKEKLYYELWGNDTYSNHSYLVKIYRIRKAAEKAMEKHRLECIPCQSEGLRDTFWIEEKTLEEIEERIRNEEKWRETVRQKWYFDEERLKSYIVILVDRLIATIDKDKQGLIKKRITLLREDNPNEEECYDFVAFEYTRKKGGGYSVSLNMNFRDRGGYRDTVCFSIQYLIRDNSAIVPSESLYMTLFEAYQSKIAKERYRDL